MKKLRVWLDEIFGFSPNFYFVIFGRWGGGRRVFRFDMCLMLWNVV
jgi:hypothetical protein